MLLECFKSNPQSSPESSYKFLKRLMGITMSSIFYKRPFSTACSFSNLSFHDLIFPLLEYNTYTEALSNSFRCIKKRKVNRVLIVIKNNVTKEILEVYTMRIIYKNIDDEMTENRNLTNSNLEVKEEIEKSDLIEFGETDVIDLNNPNFEFEKMGKSNLNKQNLKVKEAMEKRDLIEFDETDNSHFWIEKHEETGKSKLMRFFKSWHIPRVPEHIINEMKCLVASINEVAEELPIPPAQNIDINLIFLNPEMEPPNFNFARKPYTMNLGSVQTLYHHFSVSLNYLDDSKFVVLKIGQEPCVPASNETNSNQYDTSMVCTPPSSPISQNFGNSCSTHDNEMQITFNEEGLCMADSKDLNNEQNSTSLGDISPSPYSQNTLDLGVHPINNEDEQEITLDKKEPPKKCDFENCTYKVKDHWKLKRHVMRNHLHIKPYRCQRCIFASSDNWHLRRHHQRNHQHET